MGDQIREVPETSPLIGGPSTGETSIGAYLARERRLRGVSLDELADRTKIPRRSLERMEAGSLDHDPDGFARGFVRAVALELGLNAEEAVMRMLAEPSDSGETAAFASQHGGRWLLVGAGLFACVVLLASVFWGLQSRSPSAANVQESSAIVYRRDAVRSLIEEQANSKGPAAERSDSVGSASGENPNPGLDPSLGRIR
jgi:cytoskeletal protein RodZ